MKLELPSTGLNLTGQKWSRRRDQPDTNDKIKKKCRFNRWRRSINIGQPKQEIISSCNDLLSLKDQMNHETSRLEFGISLEEFFPKFQSECLEVVGNLYKSQRCVLQLSSGRLTTNLVEDISFFVQSQINAVRECVAYSDDQYGERTESGNMIEVIITDMISLVYSHLKSEHLAERERFLTDNLEFVCATANDFLRMSRWCEEILNEIRDEFKLPPNTISMLTLKELSSEVITLYSTDAVYATQLMVIIIFVPIEEVISVRLFSEDWERNLTQNEIAMSLVRTIEDFFSDVLQYLEDSYLLAKFGDALVKTTVIFYTKCAISKAIAAREESDGCRPFLLDPLYALRRMESDINVLQSFFAAELAFQIPSIKRSVDHYFVLVRSLHTYLSNISKISISDVKCSHIPSQDDTILAIESLHWFIRNVNATKRSLRALCLFICPKNEWYVIYLMSFLEKRLKVISLTTDAGKHTKDDIFNQNPEIDLGQFIVQILYNIDSNKENSKTNRKNKLVFLKKIKLKIPTKDDENGNRRKRNILQRIDAVRRGASLRRLSGETRSLISGNLKRFSAWKIDNIIKGKSTKRLDTCQKGTTSPKQTAREKPGQMTEQPKNIKVEFNDPSSHHIGSVECHIDWNERRRLKW
mmetsp:Transcript_26234/g.32171  ORF Transcript_26234/g.32171 Transcript_26234/m.32171 type:complete len:639 (-) Transcript_26234:215-2131(-)